MAPCHSRVLRWQSSVGRDTVQRIVKEFIPAWTDGLRDWQLDLVCRILDGEDVLVSTATGDGKSAIFAVPLVVLLQLQKQPAYYPDLPQKTLPMGIVITPTKGLAANIVFEINKLGVDAVAYCSEVLTEARKSGRRLWKEIASGQWPLVCVDPEHLTAKDWEFITNTELWRENLAFLCVDEIHLIHEWGAAFRHIGMFVRSRCPPTISVFGLSATIEPGLPLSTICDAMGFIPGHYHHLQRTNERPNIHFILQTLTHTLGGETFPDLLVFLAAGRKTVIYCDTIELCWRVALYLWSLLPPGLEKLTRVRLYHAMCWPDENEETIRLIRDDPRCQVVIATIAFAQGFNVKSLLDSVQLGIASTMNQLVQQEGRIGRDLISLARGVVLVQAKAVESAMKYIQANYPELAPPPSATAETAKTKSKSQTKKPSKVFHMDLSKARLLVEWGCLIALRNILYRNPPLELTSRDCIVAGRMVPCSRCLPRTNIKLDFSVAPVDPCQPLLIPFRTPSRLPVSNPVLAMDGSKTVEPPLTGKLRDIATKSLNEFSDRMRKLDKGRDPTGSTPRAAYFPTPLLIQIINNLMTINTADDIQLLIPTWEFFSRHGVLLFERVSQLQVTFRAQRDDARLVRNEKNRLRAKAKRDKARGMSDEEGEVEIEPPVLEEPTSMSIPSSSSIAQSGPVTPAKRSALQDDTNGASKRARRTIRAPHPSAAQVSQSFRPQYRPRADRSHRSQVTDENTIL